VGRVRASGHAAEAVTEARGGGECGARRAHPRPTASPATGRPSSSIGTGLPKW
jgi:hypothetical protein